MLPQCTDGSPGNQPLPVEKKGQKNKNKWRTESHGKRHLWGGKGDFFLISSGICELGAPGYFVPNSKMFSVDAQMKLEQWKGAE